MPRKRKAPTRPPAGEPAHDIATTFPAVVEKVAPIRLPLPAKVGDPNIAPTTTAEEDIGTAGQRHINRIWEYTQAILAVVVTASTLWVAGSLALKEKGDSAAFLLLSNTFFAVITFYLTRTNHTKVGGVGKGDVGR